MDRQRARMDRKHMDGSTFLDRIEGHDRYHYEFKSKENLLDLIYIIYEAISYLKHSGRL
jgi:hypothetical protein